MLKRSWRIKSRKQLMSMSAIGNPTSLQVENLKKTHSNEERKRKREWSDDEPKEPHLLKKSKSDLKLKSLHREFTSDDHHTSESHSDSFAEKRNIYRQRHLLLRHHHHLLKQLSRHKKNKNQRC